MSAEFSAFQLDRIERFAAALGPIRSHRMDRVRGMSWGALRAAMEANSIGSASARRRRSAIRLFAALTSYRRFARRVDCLLLALFGSGTASVLWLWPTWQIDPIFGWFAILGIAFFLLTIRAVFVECCLFRLHRRFGVTREELAFALSEVVADSRWEQEQKSTPEAGGNAPW